MHIALCGSYFLIDPRSCQLISFQSERKGVRVDIHANKSGGKESSRLLGRDLDVLLLIPPLPHLPPPLLDFSIVQMELVDWDVSTESIEILPVKYECKHVETCYTAQMCGRKSGQVRGRSPTGRGPFPE